MLAFKSMGGLVLEGVAVASRISGESRIRRTLRFCSSECKFPVFETYSIACCIVSSRWSVDGEVSVKRPFCGFPVDDEVEGAIR